MTGRLPRSRTVGNGHDKGGRRSEVRALGTSFFTPRRGAAGIPAEKSKCPLPVPASLLEGVAKPPASAERAAASSRSVGVTVCNGAASGSGSGMSGGNGDGKCRP